jgi:hypothetical protein
MPDRCVATPEFERFDRPLQFRFFLKQTSFLVA